MRPPTKGILLRIGDDFSWVRAKGIRHLANLIGADRIRRDKARTAKIADTIQTRIDGKRSKIADIEGTNRELWERTANVERKLRESERA